MQTVRPQRRAFGYLVGGARESLNHLLEVRRTARWRRARTLPEAEADAEIAVGVQPKGSDGSIVAVSETVVKRKYRGGSKAPFP